jgi:serine/threonine protein kinase
VSLTGTLISGRYELAEIAGEGGMATVYRGVVRGAAGFSRNVAIKRIRPEYRALRNYVDMFIEEARVGSDLAHPNIVQIQDFFEETETYYLVMEWVDGLDLGSLLREYARASRQVPWQLVAAIGIGTLRGLAAAHERRNAAGELTPVIHRDVSPHNILLATNGVVKLSDFGLARALDRIYSLTAPGTVKGKLSYLSPEVAMGKDATPLSDVFTLAAVMWEALAGHRLFEGKSDTEIFRKLRACVVPSIGLYRPDVPEAMVAALARALAKAPEERFGSALALAATLADILRREPLPGDAQRAVGDAVIQARYLARGQAGRLPDFLPTAFQSDEATLISTMAAFDPPAE